MLQIEQNNKEEKEFFIDNHAIMVFYGIIVFITVNVLLLLMFMYNYKENMVKEIEKNIYEYEEVDLSYICDMYDCIYINSDNTVYRNINHSDGYARLERSDEIIYKKYIVFENMYITSDLDVLVEVVVNNYFNGFVVVSRKNIFDIINNIYFYLLTVIIWFNILLFIYNLFSYRKYQFKHNIMLQHEGYYNSMMLLTENIHHELNTPLSVITKKINNFRGKVLNNTEHLYCDLKLKNDIDMIETSLEQIYDLLTRMKPFKDLKCQLPKDLRTLIKTACDIMSVSQHEEFEYEIEYDLTSYKLDTSKISTGEFTAIMLNFIKNSIDANAHNMKFKIHKNTLNKLSILIIDNGNGIPLNVQDIIFRKDSSTKSRTRGNGLYVNKFIIHESGGDIKLKHSDTSGTVFELTIPIIKIGGNK
jgi:signal transduction histidine kinase